MRRITALSVALLASATLLTGLGSAPTTAQAKTTKPTPISVAPATPTQGQPFTISGKIGTKVARPVTAQYKIGTTWKTLVSGKTTSTGAYTLTATTTASSLAVRVVAKKVKIKHKTYKKVTTKTRTITTSTPTPTPTTVLISRSSSGVPANDSSAQASISADGRYVAYSSDATNLVAHDTNDRQDIFVTDTVTGTTSLVSASVYGLVANGRSEKPLISADGHFVAFMSTATNLSTTTVAAPYNVFVRDLATGVTSAVSVASSGAAANKDCTVDAISADGRFIVFESSATNLVANDTNNQTDVFVRDRVLNTTIRVSVATGTPGQGNANSTQGGISADGTKVAFSSIATNLVAGDVNGRSDVFVRDLSTNITSLVSRSSTGALPSEDSFLDSLSADGRYVLFRSPAGNLVPNDNNAQQDLFLRDLTTGSTIRISVDSYGNEGNNGLTVFTTARLSTDHRYVGFSSDASNLVGNDSVVSDSFIRDLVASTTTRVSLTSIGTQTPMGAPFDDMSADGRYVVMDALGGLTAEGGATRQVYLRGPLH